MGWGRSKTVASFLMRPLKRDPYGPDRHFFKTLTCYETTKKLDALINLSFTEAPFFGNGEK
jgi:hypothetical protein